MYNKNLVLATLLDPCFKRSFFDETHHQMVKDLLFVEVEKVIESNTRTYNTNENVK